MKSERLAKGDFVELNYKFQGKMFIGVIVKTQSPYGANWYGGGLTPELKEALINDPEPEFVDIMIGDKIISNVFSTECRRLEGKELFKAKLATDVANIPE